MHTTDPERNATAEKRNKRTAACVYQQNPAKPYHPPPPRQLAFPSTDCDSIRSLPSIGRVVAPLSAIYTPITQLEPRENTASRRELMVDGNRSTAVGIIMLVLRYHSGSPGDKLKVNAVLGTLKVYV